MKSLLLVVFLSIFSNVQSLWATAQIPDIIIYKGDTLMLYNCPLGSYPNKEMLTHRRLFNGNACFFTACWRNYVATWEVIDNKLYLTKIRNACYPTEMRGVSASYKSQNDSIGNEYADLKLLFPEKYKGGKVLADWVNNTLYIPFGKELLYVHMGFESIYEFEYEFRISNGKIEQVIKLDNRKTKHSVFTSEDGHDTLHNFFKSKINWSYLPKLPKDSIVKVYVNFSADENGNIDYVSLEDSVNNAFTKEAVRVIRTIPSWDVCFNHGKHIRDTTNVKVLFVQPIDSNEMKQLIEHDKNISTYTIKQKIQIIKKREKINDSIKVYYFNEYRKKDSRDYALCYTFIDYTLNNKYIQKVLNKKELPVNEYVVRDAQKRGTVACKFD